MTTEYGSGGRIACEELYFPPQGTKEYYKIEYEMPLPGYSSITVINYETGDMLFLVVDGNGNISNKEYRKTPGFKAYEERFFLQNTATVTAKTQDGIEISNSDSYTLEIFKPLPVLSLTKSAEPDTVNPDSFLNYTVFYENTGADAEEVVLQESYHKSLVFLQADPEPDFGSINKWTIGALKRGESGKIRIRTKVSASSSPGDMITNVVNMTCKEGSFAQAAANATVAGMGLNISKTASQRIIPPGGGLTYTINYHNDGSAKLTGVVIHDYLDPKVDFLDARSYPPLINERLGKHHWWQAGQLSPGEGGIIEIDVKAKEKSAFTENATSIINTYRINSSQPEVENATLETLVVHSLWIKKTADKSAYKRDENITYVIDYGNAQKIAAERVSISDILPEVDLISASPAPDYVSGNNLTWRSGLCRRTETAPS